MASFWYQNNSSEQNIGGQNVMKSFKHSFNVKVNRFIKKSTQIKTITIMQTNDIKLFDFEIGAFQITQQ